jgi:hypothetical protein
MGLVIAGPSRRHKAVIRWRRLDLVHAAAENAVEPKLIGRTSMRIHNLYTDAKGESHFRDIEVEWVEERRGSKLSKRLPANGVIFRETQAEHNLDWHPAPRRQYIVNLDAGVKITASDGESRLIGVGEVILVEDTTGKGHLSDHVEGKIRHSLFIPIE